MVFQKILVLITPLLISANIQTGGSKITPSPISSGNGTYFSTLNDKPQPSYSQKKSLHPHIRTSYPDKAIKIIPTDVIAQFLNSPKVVNKKDLAQSPYVIALVDEHIIAGAGDSVYVRSITDPKSLSYTIYRLGEAYISPVNKEILGYKTSYIADATIERAGDPATLFIVKSTSEVRKGDRLMVRDENALALNLLPHPPDKAIDGHIISVLTEGSQIALHNIVVIDKGSVDGLQTGHTLNIYQQGQIVYDSFSQHKNKVLTLPNEVVGALVVFRTFKRVSYALVLEANRAIHILDKVQTP